jgi:hypothetical protein
MPTAVRAGYDKTSDNADDANINLTFDLGLKPKAIMVGNLVFRDVNANGTFESGIDLPDAERDGPPLPAVAGGHRQRLFRKR